MRELIAAPGVAQKMVVVLKTEGMVLMPWLGNVPALVEAWYPGQEDGNAVAEFWGAQSFRQAADDLRQFATGGGQCDVAQFPGLCVPPPGG